MRIIKAKRTEMAGIDGSSLSVEYDNMGEPFREGVRLAICDGSRTVSALLEADDVRELISALSPFVAAAGDIVQLQKHLVAQKLEKLTHVIEYSPNCAKRWLLRLVGFRQGKMDKLPKNTNDAVGYGDTLEDAFDAAYAVYKQQEAAAKTKLASNSSAQADYQDLGIDFVFLDDEDKPHRVRKHGDELWLHRMLHGSWVTTRKIRSSPELWLMIEKCIDWVNREYYQLGVPFDPAKWPKQIDPSTEG
jgi:hypothetical protein